MQRALAVVFAAISMGCMAVAIWGMVTDRFGGRSGLLLRAVALACFGAAVALGSTSR